MPKRRLILYLTLPALLAVCSYLLWPNFNPTTGTAADASHSTIHDLPANATNIHYYLPGFEGPAIAYDFQISESDFQTWIKTLSPPLIAIDPAPIHCIDPTKGPDGRHPISNGLSYSWHLQDQHIEVAFDRDQNRAYYYRAYR